MGVVGPLRSTAQSYSRSTEYELFGVLEFRTDHVLNRDLDPENTMAGGTEAVLNGRIPLQDGEVYGRSYVSLDATGTGVTHVLEQGYLRLYPASAWEVSFGRQRINWGTGYTWSVSDAVHPRNTPANRDIGFDGAAVILYPTGDISLTGVVALQDAYGGNREAFEDVRSAFYGSWYTGNLELGLSMVHQYESIVRPGVNASVVWGSVLISAEGAVEYANRLPYPTAEFDPEAAWLLFGEGNPSESDLFKAGIRVPDLGEPFPLASLAAEYSPVGDDFEGSFIVEYLYNGVGYTQTEWERIRPLLNTGEMIGFSLEPFSSFLSDLGTGLPKDGAGYPGLLKQHYVYFSASLSYRDSVQTTHSALVSLADRSVLIGHDLVLTSIDRVDLGLEIQWKAGTDDSEFGILPFELATAVFARIHL
jgi:hypothetical protein